MAEKENHQNQWPILMVPFSVSIRFLSKMILFFALYLSSELSFHIIFYFLLRSVGFIVVIFVDLQLSAADPSNYGDNIIAFVQY